MTSTYLRKKVSQNFTVIGNELIRDKNLSWKSTGFLIYLLSCADNWELNFQDLQKRKKDRLTSTRKAAEELKVAGYLKIERVRNEKGQIIYTNWNVRDTPLTVNIVAEEPYVENQHMDNPNAENRVQRKTSSISTPLNKKQQPPPASQELVSSSGNDLIFDKAINQNLHQKISDLLSEVEPILAQQMLDVVASFGDKAKSPLRLLQSFVNNQSGFDPSAGFAISKKRQNERLAAEKRRLEQQQKNKPRKNISAGKKPLAAGLKDGDYSSK